MSTWTSRERVLCSLSHGEPDRVPIFLRTSGATSILAAAYERLKSHLGLKRETSPSAFVDEWGVAWEMKPGTLHYEVASFPLRDMSLGGLDSYLWPDLAHPSRCGETIAEARALHADTPYAVVYLSGVSPFEQICLLRRFPGGRVRRGDERAARLLDHAAGVGRDRCGRRDPGL